MLLCRIYGSRSHIGGSWLDLTPRQFWRCVNAAILQQAGDDAVKLGNNRSVIETQKQDEPVELTEPQRDAIRRRMFEKTRAEN